MYHSYDIIERNRNGQFGMPSKENPVKRFIENMKETVATSSFRRNREMKAAEKAIDLLEKNPNEKENEELIRKIYRTFVYFGLTHASYKKTISLENVQKFYDIVKGLDTEESKKMIEQLDKEISIHPDVFRKTKEEKLTVENSQAEPSV